MKNRIAKYILIVVLLLYGMMFYLGGYEGVINKIITVLISIVFILIVKWKKN